MLSKAIALIILLLLLPLQKQLCYLAASWCQCPWWGGKACGTCCPRGFSLASRVPLWTWLWQVWKSLGQSNSRQVIPATKKSLSDLLHNTMVHSASQPLAGRLPFQFLQLCPGILRGSSVLGSWRQTQTHFCSREPWSYQPRACGAQWSAPPSAPPKRIRHFWLGLL